MLIFVGGVIVGELLRAATGRWNRSVVLVAETLLLGLAYAAAVKHWGAVATATLTGLAMGIQTAAVHKAAGLTVSLTYVTGTLVNIGRSIVKALLGQAPWRDAFSYMGLWCALFLGSAGGAIVAALSTPMALLVAASLLGRSFRRRHLDRMDETGNLIGKFCRLTLKHIHSGSTAGEVVHGWNISPHSCLS